jgi:hypothetical protein
MKQDTRKDGGEATLGNKLRTVDRPDTHVTPLKVVVPGQIYWNTEQRE